MSMTPDRDRLDDLLDQSSPRTTVVTHAVADELTRLRVEAETTATRTLQISRWKRPALVGLLSVMLLGGAATATATVSGAWSPWAQTPDGAHTYTLPSGAVCEARIGAVNGNNKEAREAVENFYHNLDFGSLLTDDNMDDMIAQLRTEDSTQWNDDGTTEPSGYGTKHYSADHEYGWAVSRILGNALDAELIRVGVDSNASNLSYLGETHCPGADW